MIGQNLIQQNLKDFIDTNSLPRFSIIVGLKGSGKRTLCKEIGSYSKMSCVECGIKVDDVRDVIESSYKISSPVLYIIPNADDMSVAAKNAMLKVMEEPPNNAYFIMTLNDLSQTLPTIKSRASVFYMDGYTPQELLEYASKYTLSDTEKDILQDVCETPLEVDILFSMKITEFFDYVELVTDNIAEVSGANSFKIASKIAFKEDPEKYDLELFWKAFMKVCASRLSDNRFRYSGGIQITSKYLQELSITGINKQSTFDQWLLDIRQAWMD